MSLIRRKQVEGLENLENTAVRITGNQSISGDKSYFGTNTISGNNIVTGEVVRPSDLANIITGDISGATGDFVTLDSRRQNITGFKTFESGLSTEIISGATYYQASKNTIKTSNFILSNENHYYISGSNITGSLPSASYNGLNYSITNLDVNSTGFYSGINLINQQTTGSIYYNETISFNSINGFWKII